jgi:23S rRNA pseudouridine2605 synthase
LSPSDRARPRRPARAAAGEAGRPRGSGAAPSPRRERRGRADDRDAAAGRPTRAATGRAAAPPRAADRAGRATGSPRAADRPGRARAPAPPRGAAAGRDGPAARRGSKDRAGRAGRDPARAGQGTAGGPGVPGAGRRRRPGAGRRAAATAGGGAGTAERGGTRDGGTVGAGQALRLNKALSAAGLGSRRAVEELVRAGRVAVDGEVVQDLGRRVDPTRDRVTVDGSRVVLDERRRYWLLNKPAGVITTAADPSGRPTVVGLVPDQPRVFPVGRLDRDTEGLLLLTNDGPLAYRLTHARYGVEKRYLAEVERLPADAPARLRKGVELPDGPARPVRVRVVAGSGRRRMLEVVMVEGRNREVRRLLEAVGAPVRRLVRTAVGPIRLTGLAPGEYRALRPAEIRGLYQAIGL